MFVRKSMLVALALVVAACADNAVTNPNPAPVTPQAVVLSASGDITAGGTLDLVVFDNVIYGEPKQAF